MRFVEVVADVGQIFTGDAECVDVVEVAGRQHQFVAGDRLSTKSRLDFADSDELGVGANADPFDTGDAAIVLQRLLARRLGAGADQRVIPDLEAFRRREEGHVDRVAHDRIRERARIDHEGVDAAAFGGYGARQADRPGAGDNGGFVLHETGILATFEGPCASGLA